MRKNLVIISLLGLLTLGAVSFSSDTVNFLTVTNDLTVHGTSEMGDDVTLTNAGGDANSSKLVLQAHMAAGDETQTSSIRTAWGLDPYMTIAAPSATGVETDVVHLDTASLRCAADGGLDLGNTGAGRFNDVFIKGNFDAEAGSITAQTNITADTGNIAATAGAVSASTTVSAGTTMTAGTGITSTTGDVVASAGDVIAGDDMFDVLGDVRMIYPVVSAPDPSEPFDCTAAVLGRQIIVDDTDDTTNQVVCVCLGVDDVINYEWQRADDNSTICPSLP